MNKLNVKKDDTVVIIAGKDKGKQGKIMASFPDKERVVVQNANMTVCHTKPRKQGEQGGRINKEGTINASNVMLICPKCGKATRVGHAYEGDKKVRVCKKCGKNID
ncbi:MAG: 50S ribosomal protein L24 [Clostridia bacterium]|nr:50S ribosomal protein L24 [Candidatus Pelethousia sp.]NCB30693.1 50S ribosomal protein L24 [Clostridia bacterium]